MSENLQKLLDEAKKDAGFAEKLAAAETEEELIALAAEKGLVLTAEDLKAEALEGELEDDAVEDVAGGMFLPITFGGFLKTIGIKRPKTSDLVYRGGSGGPRANDLVFRGGPGGGITANNLVFYGGLDEDDDKPRLTTL